MIIQFLLEVNGIFLCIIKAFIWLFFLGNRNALAKLYITLFSLSWSTIHWLAFLSDEALDFLRFSVWCMICSYLDDMIRFARCFTKPLIKNSLYCCWFNTWKIKNSVVKGSGCHSDIYVRKFCLWLHHTGRLITDASSAVWCGISLLSGIFKITKFCSPSKLFYVDQGGSYTVPSLFKVELCLCIV